MYCFVVEKTLTLVQSCNIWSYKLNKDYCSTFYKKIHFQSLYLIILPLIQCVTCLFFVIIVKSVHFWK